MNYYTKFWGIFLVFLFGLGQAWAQDAPRFAFPKYYDSGNPYIYSQAEKSLQKYGLTLTSAQKKQFLANELIASNLDLFDVVEVCNYLKINLSSQDRQKLVERLRTNQDTNLFNLYEDFIVGKSYLDSNRNSLAYEKTKIPILYDFNRDGKADLIMLPGVYFGPSLGYKFFGRVNSKFQYLFDNSGSIVELQISNNQAIINFRVPIIDPSETNIQQGLVLKFKEKNTLLEPKVYFAQQSFLPAKLNPPKWAEFVADTELRYSPTINDTPRDTTGYVYDSVTTTLRGNVVAEYQSNAKGYILGEKADWFLVALSPLSPPTRTSLRHGMDSEWTDEKGNVMAELKIKPYLLGWVRKKQLKK
jgi:hypothetical protein